MKKVVKKEIITLTSVAHSIENLARMVARGFGDIDIRLDKVDARLDKVDIRLDRVEKRLDKLDENIQSTRHDMSNLGEKFAYGKKGLKK